MVVKNLRDTSFDEIVDCFLLAFKNYFVKMPTNKDYYKQRWKAAKVDFNFSYGMFDNETLVGFMIHAVDERFRKLTAFNTGTGVLPKYRGKRIVKTMYGHALDELRVNGFEKTSLEVITKNDKAIRAYKDVGFEVCKNYRCYAGNLTVDDSINFELEEVSISNVDWESLPNQKFYSWDFQQESIAVGNYTFYKVLNSGEWESYFVINPETHRIAQFDVLKKGEKSWERLFSSIAQIANKISIINVDDSFLEKQDIIRLVGLENTVDQYEMEMEIVNVSA